MENLIFSLNATIPIFILMVLGVLFRKVGLMDGPFVDRMNQFVFKAAFPVLLFEDLANSDFSHVWDTRFVLFCFGVTLIGIVLAACISMMLKDKGLRGEFIQASYRSSAALLGIAFIKNIYGNAGMAPLMIIGSVPLYNTMAVLILSFTRPGQGKMDGPRRLHQPDHPGNPGRHAVVRHRHPAACGHGKNRVKPGGRGHSPGPYGHGRVL